MKHDLFAGADTALKSYLLGDIKKKTGSSRAIDPIILMKDDRGALFCHIRGEAHYCSSTDGTRQRTIPNQTLAEEDRKLPSSSSQQAPSSSRSQAEYRGESLPNDPNLVPVVLAVGVCDRCDFCGSFCV